MLDEIGRGTSTYDGLSIAWSVVEHLHGEGKVGPKTLFATHYHELTQLSETLPRLKNFAVAVKERNDEIIFVRQVTPGASERSFGIQVARLAGLPNQVVERAKQILGSLENGQKEIRHSNDSNPEEEKNEGAEEPNEPKDEKPRKPVSISKKTKDPSQLELF